MDYVRIIEDFKRLEGYHLGRIDELQHRVVYLENTSKTEQHEIGSLRHRIGELVLTIEELKEERDELIKIIKDSTSDQDTAIGSATTNLGPSC